MHRCELHALSLASRIADVYNAPNRRDPKSQDANYEYDVEERLYQEYVVEHLGFATYLAAGVSNAQVKGRTTSGNFSAAEILTKNGWINNAGLKESPYSGLSDLWVYMIGDSTTRQIFGTFAQPFHGNHFERNAKEWSREKCEPQWPEHRKHHEAPGNFPEEGWSGKCGNNEVTCHISGFGNKGILTFDWKHFPYEDYDDWLWGDDGPFGEGHEGVTIIHTNSTISANSSDTAAHTGETNVVVNASTHTHAHHHHAHHAHGHRAGNSDGNQNSFSHPRKGRPDVVTIQTGLHTCVHAHPDAKSVTNHAQIDRYIKDLPKLMTAIKNAVGRNFSSSDYSSPLNPTSSNSSANSPPDTASDSSSFQSSPPPTVIWVTSGRIGHRSEGVPLTAHDECVWKFNVAARKAARQAGFAVLEREEIERRLLFLSMNHESGVGKEEEIMRFKMHLDAPAPQIVATALLSLISCLRNESFFEHIPKAFRLGDYY